MITPHGASSQDALGDWGRDDHPDSIGPYEIIGVLGKGGMGVVFDAVDQRQRRVALKVIRPQGDPDSAQLLTARFLREAKILEQLDHPCVVRLVDSGDVDGVLYLAMERIEGVSLLTIRRRGALSFDPLVQLGIQLADALSHMHEAGIVHRDIKPANILIDAKGQPVITDFGISGMNEATGITRMGDLLGSPGFMAPEVTEGMPPSELSDQFALGRLLYELGASGPAKKLPKNAPILEILSASLEIDWNRFPTSDRWPTLESILRRTVATHPGERYPNAAAVRSALQALTSADLLDSETLSEHVQSLGEKHRTAYEEVEESPFVERTTLDNEDETVRPAAFEPKPRPFSAMINDLYTPAPPPLPSPTSRTLPMDAPVPVMPALEIEISDHARSQSVAGPKDSVTAMDEAVLLARSEDRAELARSRASVTAMPLPLPPLPVTPLPPPDPQSTAVTVQDMPLFELAKREDPSVQQPQILDLEDAQILRLERQIARLKEQLAQARKEAVRAPDHTYGRTILIAVLAVGIGAIAGFLARASVTRPAPALILVAPTTPLTDANAVYRATNAPGSAALENARADFDAAMKRLQEGDVEQAETYLERCIETADLPACHKMLGTVLALRGDPSANTHFEHYLTIAPTDPDADAIRRILEKR
jgi:serine/threonine protein kinase